jgi:hypothetical protein
VLSHHFGRYHSRRCIMQKDEFHWHGPHPRVEDPLDRLDVGIVLIPAHAYVATSRRSRGRVRYLGRMTHEPLFLARAGSGPIAGKHRKWPRAGILARN